MPPAKAITLTPRRSFKMMILTQQGPAKQQGDSLNAVARPSKAITLTEWEAITFDAVAGLIPHRAIAYRPLPIEATRV
jgi:hypothetical protein